METATHHHASHDGGVHGVGDQGLLTLLQEATQGPGDVLQAAVSRHTRSRRTNLLAGLVEFLGGGDDTDDLSPVGGHQAVVRQHHGVDKGQPGDGKRSAVFRLILSTQRI